MSIVEIVVGLIGALGGLSGLITAVVAIRKTRSAARKDEVDANKVQIEALDVIINTLRAGYARLAKENEELHVKVDMLKEQNEDLQRQLVALDHELTAWRTRYKRLCGWAVRRGWDPKEADVEEDLPPGDAPL